MIEHNELGQIDDFSSRIWLARLNNSKARCIANAARWKIGIKELQLGLFADLASCTAWWSNQLRVMFSSLAYVLWQTVREKGLVGISLAMAPV